MAPVGENPVLNAAGTDTLTVMTYNVKNCGTGEKIADVAADIRAEDPDVVCLQEVDRNVKRSGGRDELQALANELGMNYVFFPALRRRYSERLSADGLRDGPLRNQARG